MSARYLALVHHPVLDRTGATITTAVTNLDVHDIARTARTYGFDGYFVVTPLEAQRLLVERIVEHWTRGSGARRVPERGEALAICEVVPSIAEAVGAVEDRVGRRPRIAATAARILEGHPPIDEPTLLARAEGRPLLLLFGTGHGLAPEAVEAADVLLRPIRGAGDYNHLSVRAAVAITLDRLAPDAD